MTCCHRICIFAQKCYPDPKGKSSSSSSSSSISVPKHKSKCLPLTPAPTSPCDVKPSLKSAPPKHRVPQKDIPTHSPAGSAPTAASSGKSIREKPPIAKPTIKCEPDTFTDLFGPPLQSRPSPEPTKHRVSILMSICAVSKSLFFHRNRTGNRKSKKKYVSKVRRLRSQSPFRRPNPQLSHQCLRKSRRPDHPVLS